MPSEAIRQAIEQGKTYLGIEFGSTRIKAVLVDAQCSPIAEGGHTWENRLENGIWTYRLEDVWGGLAACYQSLKQDVFAKYGLSLTRVGAIGISAMMHGYLPFDAQGSLLTPFRTWRNTITGQAAEELTALLGFNIPQRWSIAHLDQAILGGEEHVGQIAFLTTLAGYVHWRLTGQKVLGVGDASGMFPIDSQTGLYDAAMLRKYEARIAARKLPWTLEAILPKVLNAGDAAGTLTEAGAKLLDPSGELEAGMPLCPPEGDAGTGMVATNSVAPRTGNVSAGTSIFAMLVLDKALSKVHSEIDMVTTPSGRPVAMAHCNNCTSDLNAWVNVFAEFAGALGEKADMNTIYGLLYNKALEGEKDCGGLLSYNYFSGEHVTGLTEGRPLFVRQPDSAFTLANFMRSNLYAALATLKIGVDILLCEEKVSIDQVYGHGGLFKTEGVGQRMLAAAIRTPVSVMETAGEGGAWGIALLAAFAAQRSGSETLEAYLEKQVFAGKSCKTLKPDPADEAGFDAYLARYVAGLPIERAAVAILR